MKAKVVLYENDGVGDQGYPVKIILSHNRKTSRKTIAHSFPDTWDNFYHLPTPYHPDYNNLDEKIRAIRDKAQTEEFQSLQGFKEAYNYLTFIQKREQDFFIYGEQRAVYMDKVGREGNARAYRIALKELEKYRSVVFFKDITRQFLEAFKQYKKAEGVKNTTVRNYLYEIRAIYNNAVRTGLIEDQRPFTGLFTDIPVRKRRARNAYFEKEDIKQLEQAEFSQKNYNIAVDLALLQFYLCGADLIDVVHLRKDQIYKGRVFLERAKLGEKKYEFDIKLTHKAERLLNKYPGEGEYVMYFADNYNYPTFRVKMYRCLQQVKKKLQLKTSPKDHTFTWKVMRHSFATLGKFERIEEDLLRELMGHERNDIDTVYKDKYPEKDRDQAQKQIISL